MTTLAKDRYQLPGAGHRAAIVQRFQVKPHEGFSTGVIHPRGNRGFKVGEGPQETFMATPPDWTLAAACVGSPELVDDPNAHTYRTETKPMCEGCPVRDLCLSEALSFEVFEDDGRPLPPKLRYGIWGGLKGKDRARLAAEEPTGVCGAGEHDLGTVGAFYTLEGSWRCKACNRDRKRESRARQRGSDLTFATEEEAA